MTPLYQSGPPIVEQKRGSTMVLAFVMILRRRRTKLRIELDL